MSRKPMHTQLDHSPDPEPRDAPAPRRDMTGAGRTLLDAMRQANGDGPRADGRVNDPRELMRRVAAAVACEVPAGAHGDTTQRAECEGAILCQLVNEARGETGGASAAPRREHCRMMFLRWRARDWQRAEKRRRSELAADIPDMATADLAGRPGTSDAPEWSPGRAHAGALQLCALLGLKPGGTVETALYAYLRGADATTADIATETGLTHGGARNALTQGRTLLRAAYPNPADLLRALLLLDRRDAGAPASVTKRTRAAVKQYRRDTWRDRADAIPGDVAARQATPTDDLARRTRDATGAVVDVAQHARTHGRTVTLHSSPLDAAPDPRSTADAAPRTRADYRLAALLNVPPSAPNPGLDPNGEFAGTRRDP